MDISIALAGFLIACFKGKADHGVVPEVDATYIAASSGQT